MTVEPAQLLHELGPWGLVVVMFWDKLAGWARSLRSQGGRIGGLEDRVAKLEERLNGSADRR